MGSVGRYVVINSPLLFLVVVAALPARLFTTGTTVGVAVLAGFGAYALGVLAGCLLKDESD
jgi:hypothetical protein